MIRKVTNTVIIAHTASLGKFIAKKSFSDTLYGRQIQRILVFDAFPISLPSAGLRNTNENQQ